jgi:hypothetical protein
MLPTLQSFKKPKRVRTAIRGLRGLGKKHLLPPVPDLLDDPERRINLVDDELTRLAEELGDVALAKRILKLKAKFFNANSGTIPELIVMDWLDRHNFRYEFQFWILGGRALRGGQVLDFVVDVGTRVIIIEPQTYWHTRPGNRQRDEAQRLALLGVTIWGKPTKVVECWERRLLDKYLREPVMQAAVNGVELGR